MFEGEIGNRVKEVREGRGLSQDEVAALMRPNRNGKPYDGQYIYLIESGRVEGPGPRVLQNLAGALGVPVSVLMGSGGASERASESAKEESAEEQERGRLVRVLARAEGKLPMRELRKLAELAQVMVREEQGRDDADADKGGGAAGTAGSD